PKSGTSRGLQGPSLKPISSSLPPRGMLEDKNFHKAVDQILVEKVPYFCQFWNEQSARFMVQKSNLYLVPNLSPPSSTCEEEKSKEQEKDRQGLGEEDKRGLGE
ncbi:hypothetical protein H1C71_020822, partial [Ictidomys tridecemlineatus]